VKRILRKHGYPPDLQDSAVQTVLQQAEALSSSWVDAGWVWFLVCQNCARLVPDCSVL